MQIYFVVFGFILFDILTGFIKGLAKEGINSTLLRKGLYHKVSEGLAILGAGLLERAADVLELGVTIPAVNAVAIYICLMELVSIIENLCELNPSMKKFFKPYLEKIKNEEEENGNPGN